jgi:3-oxoadipate enol-lactonase/4-carboxymuconolactone decarboxylase
MTQPTLLCTLKPAADSNPDAELIVLGPSLGTTTALWEGVVDRLPETFRVLRFDLPGHGFSPAAAEAFTMADLADAVIALVDSVGGGAFHYAGISLGGAIGLQLAVDHADRLSSVALLSTAAKIGTSQGWHERAAMVRASGTPALVAGSADRWFAPGFLDRDPAAGSAALEKLMDIDDESYALCCEALAAFDLTDALGGIRVRALCVAGEHDQPTPPAKLAELAQTIPGAHLETITGVAHLPALERPDVVAELLLRHVGAGGSGAANTRTVAETYNAGMATRREVLGNAHVDAATAAITPETSDFQDFITRYAWGEVWTRPGLDRRTRSFLTIASLVTAGHSHELALHVRAALTNGLTRAEISEAILHTAIYAGVPAANTAFAVARDTFASLDAADSDSGADSAPGNARA